MATLSKITNTRMTLVRFLFAFFLILFLLPQFVQAARLFSSGCELQAGSAGQATDNLEWDTGASTEEQITTSVQRSGLASCEAIVGTNEWGEFVHQFTSVDVTTDLYVRFYFRIADMSAENDVSFFMFEQAGSGDDEGSLVIDTDGTISWHDDDSTNLGTSASALSLNTWYRIEVNYDAADGVEVKVDGTTVISVGAHDGDGVGDLNLGICPATATVALCGGDDLTSSADFYFDDIAINDTSGGSQTGYAGAGSIVHMQPDGAGDNSECAAGSWASVDEVTPDDATTICTLTTDLGGDTLDTTVESSSNAGIDSYDTVTLVQVGAREAALSAAAESWNLRIKSASGGTTSDGSTATHNDATYRTNGDAEPRNYTLTSYTDPTTAAAWTPTGTNSLDNMQIGANSVDANPDIQLSTLWALIEYVDGAAPVVGPSRFTIFGGRFQIIGGRFIIR